MRTQLQWSDVVPVEDSADGSTNTLGATEVARDISFRPPDGQMFVAAVSQQLIVYSTADAKILKLRNRKSIIVTLLSLMNQLTNFFVTFFICIFNEKFQLTRLTFIQYHVVVMAISLHLVEQEKQCQYGRLICLRNIHIITVKVFKLLLLIQCLLTFFFPVVILTLHYG